MGWLLSLFIGVITGLITMVAAFATAEVAVGWYRISSFEGGAGYFVIAMALVGLFAGFVIGTVACRIVAGRPKPGVANTGGPGSAAGHGNPLTRRTDAPGAGFLVPLPGRPGAQFLDRYRFRIVARDAPIRTEVIGPFEIATVASGFSEVTSGGSARIWAADARFRIAHRGQPITIEQQNEFDALASLAGPVPALTSNNAAFTQARDRQVPPRPALIDFLVTEFQAERHRPHQLQRQRAPRGRVNGSRH